MWGLLCCPCSTAQLLSVLVMTQGPVGWKASTERSLTNDVPHWLQPVH